MKYSDNLKLITEINFHEEILSGKNQNALAYFSASWCGPCKMIKPIIEDLANSYKNDIFVGHIDIDQNRNATNEYSVYTIPTFLYFKNGNLVNRHSGFTNKEQILRSFDIKTI